MVVTACTKEGCCLSPTSVQATRCADWELKPRTHSDGQFDQVSHRPWLYIAAGEAVALRFACIGRVGEAPVMKGPEDPAAAGRDRVRAGHADREQVIGTLKDAFVQGRLTRDELDTRAGLALAARTCADLAALTADIPAADIPAADIPPADIPPAPAAAGPPCPPAPARRRPLAKAAAGSGACLIIAAAAMRAHRLPRSRGPPHSLSGLGLPSCCSWSFSPPSSRRSASWAYGVAASWELRRSRRQLPPGPGPGGHDLDGERRGGTGQDPDLPPSAPTRPDADLRVHQSRPRRQHIPARASVPRGERPAPGAA